MKVTKGKTHYSMPKDWDGTFWPFCQGALKRLTHEQITGDGEYANLPPGRPIGVCPHYPHIIVWPAPDKSYDVVIEYIPGTKEI